MWIACSDENAPQHYIRRDHKQGVRHALTGADADAADMSAATAVHGRRRLLSLFRAAAVLLDIMIQVAAHALRWGRRREQQRHPIATAGASEPGTVVHSGGRAGQTGERSGLRYQKLHLQTERVHPTQLPLKRRCTSQATGHA